MPFRSICRFPLVFIGATSLALATLKPASAISLTFTGSISGGETVTDTLPPEDSVSQDSVNPANWDFWTFEGTAGESERFTVRRLSEALDPALGIWFGTEADTDSYTSLFDDSLNTMQVAFADDEINTPGPFGDPTVRFTLPETGTYTVAVASFISDPSDEPLGYTLRVPFTDDLAMIFGSGLVLGCGVLLKRRHSRVASSQNS